MSDELTKTIFILITKVFTGHCWKALIVKKKKKKKKRTTFAI